MLHNSIDQAAYDGLPQPVQAEYTKGTDGKFALQTDIDVAGFTKQIGDKDATITDLTTKHDTLKSEYDTYKQANKGKVDVAAVKLEGRNEAIAELKPRLEREEKLSGYLQRTVAENTAKDIARAVGGEKNEYALLPHVSKSLTVKLDGDEPKVVVLDKDGKESTETTDQLAERIRKDPKLSHMAIVSRSNGGGGRTAPINNPQRQSGGESLATMKPEALAERLAGKR